MGRALPRPLLHKKDPSLRNMLFVPVLLVLWFLLFFLTGLILDLFTGAIIIGLALAVAATVLLLGVPTLEGVKDETRRAGIRRSMGHVPWLFLPLALILAVTFYVLVGLSLTQTALGPSLVIYVSIPLSILLGLGTSYLVVGIPRLSKPPAEYVPPGVRDNLKRNRAWFFFPALVLFGAVLTFIAGLATAAGGLSGPLQLAVSLPLGYLLGGFVAWRVFGWPPVLLTLKNAIPTVPPHVRPWLFFPFGALFGLILFLLLGLAIEGATDVTPNVSLIASITGGFLFGFGIAYAIFGLPRAVRARPGYAPENAERLKALMVLAFTLLVGPVLTYVAGIALDAAALPPKVAILGSIAVGYFLAFGLALVLVGRPRLGLAFPADERGTRRRVRLAVSVPLFLASGSMLFFLIGNATDRFTLALLLGYGLAAILALFVSGAIEAFRTQPGSGVFPAVPEKFKFAVFLPVLLVVTVSLYSLLSTFTERPEPALFASLGMGVLIAFVVTEEHLVRDYVRERRSARTRRAETRRKRKEVLRAGGGPPLH